MLQAIKKYISPQLQVFVKESRKAMASAMGNLTSAVAISLLVKKYQLNLNHDEHAGLLKSLLIHPDAESGRCPDYEELVKEIGDTKYAPIHCGIVTSVVML